MGLLALNCVVYLELLCGLHTKARLDPRQEENESNGALTKPAPQDVYDTTRSELARATSLERTMLASGDGRTVTWFLSTYIPVAKKKTHETNT